MNRFFTNKKLITLLISVIVFISLLTYSLTQTETNFVQGFTNDVTAFVGRIFSRPVNSVIDTFDTVSNVQDTFEENQRLKSELDQLSQTEAEMTSLREENDRLQEEIGLQDSLMDHQIIAGNVISRNPDYWVDQLIVDLGTQDGVEVGMPVMSGEGLIGQISEANPTSSKVTLLTNIDASANQVSSELIVDDEDGESEVIHGLIEGYDSDSNQLVMGQITSETEISEGETVTTSGLGGSYPRSLVIGTVEEVTLDDQGLAQQLYIEPAANFNDVRVVSVVDRVAETIDQEDQEDQEESEEEE